MRLSPVGHQVLRGWMPAVQRGDSMLMGQAVERRLLHPGHLFPHHRDEAGRPPSPVHRPDQPAVPVDPDRPFRGQNQMGINVTCAHGNTGPRRYNSTPVAPASTHANRAGTAVTA